MVPFFGAALILHLVSQHSPEAIPRAWVPWPFKSLVFGKQRPANRNRDDNDADGVNLAISDHQHSSTGMSSGGDGGGGD